MAIEVVNRQRLVRLDRKAVASVASATLESVGRSGASLTVAFVRDRRIRDLNRDYRGKDRATDVLSFPAGDGRVGPAEAMRGADPNSMGHIGDVIISTDTALDQAREAGHSLAREVSELVIHGTLHLCGYDHENDRGEMNRLELRLRRKLLG
ncbi:MAG: rRNA maturation RNase YbeY [Blastocatellia bacterium]